MPNLNDMTEAQREEYRQKVSEAIGLDPEMRLLEFIWMASEEGPRNLVLYCRRGAAEILRAKRSISVTKLTQGGGEGYVSFIAEGADKTGRTEVAVGSASLAGLRNEKLAHAVMTASTRALRRLTLQFVGHGLLDETEVSAVTTDIGQAASSGALPIGIPVVVPPMPAPTVPVSIQPGKDITPAVPRAGEPGFDMEGHIKKVYEEGAKALAEMPNSVIAASNEVILPPAPPTGMNITEAPVEEKKKRTRRSRNTVSIASPGQSTEPVQTEMPVANLDKDGKLTPVSVPPATAKEPEQGANGNRSAVNPALAETPPVQSLEKQFLTSAEPLKPTIPVLSVEKQKEYRERLGKYSQDILPRAGMTPSENIGGCTMKLAKFAALHTGTERSKLSEEQFEDLLGFLDNYSQSNGPAKLVEYINKALGV